VASERLIAECASAFHLPGMSAWCPPQLLDVSQLTGYYKQQTLEVKKKKKEKKIVLTNTFFLTVRLARFAISFFFFSPHFTFNECIDAESLNEP
jgi:hypothetical protein